jgi:hypothetical protein
MKSEADKFIAVTKTTDAAERLIASSPKSYAVQTPKRPDPVYLDLKKPTHPSNWVITEPIVGETPQVEGDTTVFTITISPKSSQHADQGVHDPLQGSWPDHIIETDTYTSSILKQTLPSNMATTGLAHWAMPESLRKKQTPQQERIDARKWIPRHIIADRMAGTTWGADRTSPKEGDSEHCHRGDTAAPRSSKGAPLRWRGQKV